MTVAVVMLSLAPILWERGIRAGCEEEADRGANRPRNDQVDIHALILVPVFFAMIKHRALRKGSLGPET
jgi:Cu(I)/Ag(I) efflux system membrane protein CusA/SilA